MIGLVLGKNAIELLYVSDSKCVRSGVHPIISDDCYGWKVSLTFSFKLQTKRMPINIFTFT